MKPACIHQLVIPSRRRSLTGAWIETQRDWKSLEEEYVAPLRGRGLKPYSYPAISACPGVAPLRGRGLKPALTAFPILAPSRSLTGAWIETGGCSRACTLRCVAPLRGRGLKPAELSLFLRPPGRSLTGAWIETRFYPFIQQGISVAPLRGRGLKRTFHRARPFIHGSLPYGGVD